MSSSQKLYDNKVTQVIWKTIVSDTVNPVSIMVRLPSHKNTFLLESVEGGTKRGRYSIIGMKPDLWWKSNRNIAYKKSNEYDDYITENDNTFLSLKKLLDDSYIDLPKPLPRMAAGVFGYIGYDNIKLIENINQKLEKDEVLPDSLLIRPSLIIIFDNLKDELSIISTLRYDNNKTYNDALNQSNQSIQEILDLLSQPLRDNYEPVDQQKVEIKSNTPKNTYLDMVEKAKKYIFDGDIFQVVLSQRFESDFHLPPFELYRSLRRINPSPFLFYLNFENFSVVGSSPEILIRLFDDEITVRPIAGTRPRGKDDIEDNKNKESLLSDPKELAEHLMLLDLGRNDVGKVSKKGSVAVTDKFFVELYSHVMHIVSNVTGILDPKNSVIDVLKAGFPAGTVSGAPKIRAMEIIEELEMDSRNIYAGCVGYFSARGDMDTCITLRTAIIKDKKMYVQAGAGIVADSIPINEYKECNTKAKALFNAAQAALDLNLEKRNTK